MSVGVLEQGSPEELSDQELAIRIGHVLEKRYPNHPFIVGFQGGGLVLRHLAIANEVHRVLGRDGFASLLPRDKLGTPKEVTHTVTMFAGEMLEAFQLPREAWDGRPPVVPKAMTDLVQKH